MRAMCFGTAAATFRQWLGHRVDSRASSYLVLLAATATLRHQPAPIDRLLTKYNTTQAIVYVVLELGFYMEFGFCFEEVKCQESCLAITEMH